MVGAMETTQRKTCQSPVEALLEMHASKHMYVVLCPFSLSFDNTVLTLRFDLPGTGFLGVEEASVEEEAVIR